MRVTVFCGAAPGNDPKYAKAAEELGAWIAESHGELVYGGGGVGLMGVVARNVLEHGGTAHGVMPQVLVDRDAAYKGLSSLEIVDDMDQRKRRMMELGDVYIALPGGPGTLEEIAETFSWSRLGMTDKPSVFFDLDHYWQPIIDMYDRMVGEGFLTAEDRGKLLFTDSFGEIEAWMSSYVAPRIRTYNRPASGFRTVG